MLRAALAMGLERLPSHPGGYTLDLDSTHLLHEDARQKEVRSAYTPEGFRRCLHPLLGMISEVPLVAGFWPGLATPVRTTTRWPSPRSCSAGYRAGYGWDWCGPTGLCDERLLEFWEAEQLPYIGVAGRHQPVRSLISRATHWRATDLAGDGGGRGDPPGLGMGSAAAGGAAIRHRTSQRPEAGGRELIECPGYRIQALITSLPSVDGLRVAALQWARGLRNIIKELANAYALPQLCLKRFYATEAALSLSVLAYNLCVLFQRHVGWEDRVTTATLRMRLFTTGGIVSRTGGYLTLRLAVREGPLRAWWQRLFEKLSCPWPNCIAVEPIPINPTH
ncbi:MAG: hypothetical protein U1G08_15855 [Verrucomicrobiota bacterium]